MLRETLAFLKDEPPVIVDWLAVESYLWRRINNIGLTLSTVARCISTRASPVPGGIEETVRNLREMSADGLFQRAERLRVAAGLICATTRRCAEKFFHRLHAMFFSGAALSPYVWNSLDELAVQETGFRVPMLTGLGATETAPFFMSVRPATQPFRSCRASGVRQ